MKVRTPVLATGVVCLAIGLVAGPIGLNTRVSAATHSGAAITPPAVVAKAGKLIFCSDISYPPEEFYQGSSTVAQGSDIEVGTAIAKLMGVPAEFDNTGFDGIIIALRAHKCDAIISGMNDTAKRRQQVDFVDYLNVGQAVVVQKGNPQHITKLDDLCGKAVGSEISTTNYDFLTQYSATCKAHGKPAINAVAFKTDTDGANALRAGKLDAYETDAPVVAYYISKDPARLQFGIPAINPIPVGIALRKEDKDLKAALQKGVDMIYANGTMKQILSKWKMLATANRKL